MSTVDEPAQRAASAPAPMAKLNAALAKAQGEFPEIPRSKTVKTGAYEFSYAPLESILKLTRGPLTKNGLALTQLLEHGVNGTPSLRTELRHASGETLGASFPLPSVPTSPQQLGSLITYLRRYAIVSMLGIASEEDDDGRRAVSETPGESPFRPPAEGEALSNRQMRAIWALKSKLVKQGAFTEEQFDEQLAKEYEATVSGLTRRQASELLDRLAKTEQKVLQKEADEIGPPTDEQ